MLTPYAFFKANAGYSYDPKVETPEQGRQKCARKLAQAERKAAEAGISFEWRQDDITNRDFTDDGEEYYLWCCIARDIDGNVVASLGGVDFGGKEPWGEQYRRVVEAELVLEAL